MSYGSLTMYRKDDRTETEKTWSALPTRRIPNNIPYLVDNLWEWKRPENYPSRRHATCCSPTREGASASGVATTGRIYRVEVLSGEPIVQIRMRDAKDHGEVKELPKLLIRLLGGSAFGDLPIESKRDLAPLWCPVLSREEVDHLIRSGRLAPHAQEIWDAIHFWEDATLLDMNSELANQEGELFFSAQSYRLVPDGE